MVEDANDFVAVAMVRNECRMFMTGNQSELTLRKQLNYMSGVKDVLVIAEIPIGRSLWWPVGYGLLRDGWLTVGVAGGFRGIGVGRKICNDLIARGARRLKVLVTNRRGISLYKKLMFTEANRTNRVITMRLA